MHRLGGLVQRDDRSGGPLVHSTRLGSAGAGRGGRQRGETEGRDRTGKRQRAENAEGMRTSNLTALTL